MGGTFLSTILCGRNNSYLFHEMTIFCQSNLTFFANVLGMREMSNHCSHDIQTYEISNKKSRIKGEEFAASGTLFSVKITQFYDLFFERSDVLV